MIWAHNGPARPKAVRQCAVDSAFGMTNGHAVPRVLCDAFLSPTPQGIL